MLIPDPIVPGADALDAIKTYLRIDHDDEDAVLAALLVAALARGEAYVQEILIERGFVETRVLTADWTPLSARPVVAITAVADAANVALAVGSYAIDLDLDGIGRVRATTAASQRVRVAFRAGRATRWSLIAEPVRHGIVRLVAHDYAVRDRGDDAGPPPAVLDLWRGARRMQLR